MKKALHPVRLIIKLILATVIIALTVWIIWGNTALECNTYTLSSSRLPASFDGYRIAQVSDLHNTQMGKNNEKLIEMLQTEKPDMIAITGDLIDSRNTDISVALDFAKQAVQIAPCYYVTGNHESRIADYELLKDGLINCGVAVLEDEMIFITIGDESIALLGVQDPTFWGDDASYTMRTKLQNITENNEQYTVLLSHRPELFSVYVDLTMDLVLSGHAHGGQFRLPGIGGLFAPHQGFLPQYDSGLYTQGYTNMIVSRGIGNSIFPFRVNNPPEVVIIQLQTV